MARGGAAAATAGLVKRRGFMNQTMTLNNRLLCWVFVSSLTMSYLQNVIADRPATKEEAIKNPMKDGEWEEWQQKSECSRTCGVGIQSLERKCHKVGLNGQPHCTGPSTTYVSCNIQNCPPASQDFRLIQCQHYNGIAFNGSYYEWKPYHHASSKCELYCQATGHAFYYRHSEKVIDGTPCDNQSSSSVCVNGVCQALGCDRKLGSGRKNDDCMVCGGDGKTCQAVRGSKETYNMKTGYNELIAIPEGATSVRIQEVTGSKNYLATKNRKGVYFFNGDFVIETDEQRKLMAGSLFDYKRSLDGLEYLTSEGPLKEEIYVEVLKQPGMNSTIKYEFFVRLSDDHSRLVSGERNDQMDIQGSRTRPKTASWSAGEWGACSTTCGRGIKKRSVLCEIQQQGIITTVDDHSCQQPKPSTVDPCNLDILCTEWISGTWSDCSRACGAGEQTRDVQCIARRQNVLGQHEIQPERSCDKSVKPISRKTCTNGPCERFDWIVSEWSGCNDQCETMSESRVVFCSSIDGRVFPDDRCDAQRRPEMERNCPLMASCLPQGQWHASQWTKCSSKCGKGTQKRKVFCALSDGEILRIVESVRCDPDHKMEEEKDCAGRCTALWYNGPFGKCSRDCDGGQRRRLVLCFEDDTVVDQSLCDGNARPDDDEDCNQHPCTDDELLPSDVCQLSAFGCCPDGLTSAEGPHDEGCSGRTDHSDPDENGFSCYESYFGCCPDGITSADGFDGEGCHLVTVEPEERAAFTTHDIPQEEESSCSTADDVDGSGDIRCIRIPDSGLLPLTECSQSYYGCCEDGVTSAGGPDGRGCPDVTDGDCRNQVHGCCPDGETRALGPNFEGCSDIPIPTQETCLDTTYGCCRDGVTAVAGPNGEGCDDEEESQHESCHHSHYGCCDDGVSPAHGPNHEGCPAGRRSIHTLSCDATPYGCCLDGARAARGPNFYGCDDGLEAVAVACVDSPYGCCLDGETLAAGPQYMGCAPTPNGGGAICGLPKDDSFCTNYTVKWFFDVGKGKCDRFWYGGCVGVGGGANRFDSEETCQSTCVQPQTIDRCFLPPSGGSCRAAHTKYYYNSATKQCEQFSYGGCSGNNNRFDSIELCEEICAEPLKPDICGLSYSSGPCRGRYERWFYDKENGICRPFIYGGCRGNENRFETLETCQHRCKEPVSHICRLEPEAGPCDAKTSQWFFNSAVSQCEVFTYGGCQGNANRFSSKEECSLTCKRSIKEKIVDMCRLPSEVGLCLGYFERWHHDPDDGYCKQFIYGGCGGNSNRFESEGDCRTACKAKQPIDVCSLPEDAGSCNSYVVHYFHDVDSQRCRQFYYGGCGGNGNNFKTLEECEKKCERSDVVVEVTDSPAVQTTTSSAEHKQPVGGGGDLCSLPPEPGPCRKALGRWYYDPIATQCYYFSYGGCHGNENRFMAENQCMSRCGHSHGPVEHTDHPTDRDVERVTEHPSVSLVTSAVVTDVHPLPPVVTDTHPLPPVVPDDACHLERDPGPCTDMAAVWYFEPNSRTCRRFLYGGCGGNGNRFESVDDCEKTCLTEYVVQSSTEYVDHRQINRLPSATSGPTEILSPSKVKAGECPRLHSDHFVSGLCASECDDDRHCEGTAKCCHTSCGRICTEPEQSEESHEIHDSNVFQTIVGEVVILPYIGSQDSAHVQWYKDGQIINLQSSDHDHRIQILVDGSLEIKNVQTADAASYVYHDGEVTVTVTLEVFVPAKIEDSGTREIILGVGVPFELNCHFVGIPKPALQWSKDGYPAHISHHLRPGPLDSGTTKDPSSVDPKISGHSAVSVTEVTLSDSGNYTCEIHNHVTGLFTSVDRKTYVVRVLDSMTVRLTAERSVYQVGDDARLTCDTTARKDVEMEISWTKDGEGLLMEENGTKYKHPSNGELIIDNLVKEDKGEYVCMARRKNTKEEETSSLPIIIDVKNAPIPPNCIDKPWYANCELIIEAKLCRHPYFSIFCCKSCHEAGRLP